MNVCQGEGIFSWVNSELTPDIPKPILFVGSAETLLRREAGIPEPNWDFLLGPWDADELIFRAFKLFTSRADHSREVTSAKSVIPGAVAGGKAARIDGVPCFPP